MVTLDRSSVGPLSSDEIDVGDLGVAAILRGDVGVSPKTMEARRRSSGPITELRSCLFLAAFLSAKSKSSRASYNC